MNDRVARLVVVTAVAVALASSPARAQRVTFQNPPEISSVGGVLTSTLTVQPAEVVVGGRRVSTNLYNGMYIPPTFRVNPGDTIKLRLVNAIDQITNIHTHGLNVSPLGNSDNVFNHILPGTFFDYEITLPPDHPVGMFYYHPHQPGLTEQQIGGGMSGGLIVGNVLAPFPELAGITERVMLLKDIKIRKGRVPADLGPTGPTRRTINGLFRPVVDIRPGELQLWRFANIGADIYYKLRLGNHQFFEIARDGNLHNQAIRTRELLMPPSSRIDVLVRGARKRGRYRLRAKRFNTGPAGDHYPSQVLATVVARGPRVRKRAEMPIPAAFPVVDDLRTAKIANRRTITFSETANGDTFFIDGKTFDHDRIDTTVQLGDVEEWTIVNASKELHVFHIHQLDFQVTEVNGVAQPFVGRQDTVNLPFQKKKTGPGVVKVLIPFTNPVIVGKFVYHCHIGEHEDNGMMAVIEVVDPAGQPRASDGGHH